MIESCIRRFYDYLIYLENNFENLPARKRLLYRFFDFLERHISKMILSVIAWLEVQISPERNLERINKLYADGHINDEYRQKLYELHM